MTRQIAPLTPDQIREMHAWRYPGELSVYSLGYIPIEEAIAFFMDPENGYFAILGDDGSLEGFCNFGWDGQVEGGDYSAEALDVGIGLRPDFVSRGLGTGYAQLVFEEARRRFPGLDLRVTIMAFNIRAIRVCEKNGFAITARFERPSDGQEFVVLTAPA